MGRDPGPKGTVLVVDDDVSVRESLRTLIRLAGWRVETFSSAGEFLDRPPDETPSCGSRRRRRPPRVEADDPVLQDHRPGTAAHVRLKRRLAGLVAPQGMIQV